MPKTLPLFVTTASGPNGTTRRTIIANFDEVMAAGASVAPSEIYGQAEARYSELVATLRKMVGKGRLSNEDRTAIGDAVTRLDNELKAFDPNLKLVIVNLHQALAEDLGKDINTVETYMLFSKATKAGNVAGSASPNEAIIKSLKAQSRPMTPREIAEASGVNYNTIRRAVKELVKAGKVAPGPRRGSYVSSPSQ